VGLVLDQASLPGTVGTPTSWQTCGRVLVAHQGHRLVRGADELDLATAAKSRRSADSRRKAVARMNRLHVADLGGADHAVDLSGSCRRLGGPTQYGLVARSTIRRHPDQLAENGHRLGCPSRGSAKDAQGDFTAIGNQDSLVHGSKKGTVPLEGISSIGIVFVGKGTVWEKGDSPHLPERPGGCFAQMGTVPFSSLFPPLLLPRIDLNSGCPNSTGETVLGQHGDDPAGDLRRNLIEDLHRLDDADGRSGPMWSPTFTNGGASGSGAA